MHRVAVCFFAFGLSSLGVAAWPQNTQCCPVRRTISVNGTGTVTADADLAIVRVGYKLYGPDAKTAYGSALDASNAIMKALTDSGIPKSAIESTSQVIQHTAQYDLQYYPWNSPERQQREFTASQSWTIRVKPDDAAHALSLAVNAGANESGWIEWVVTDPSALEAQASSKAVADARAIAEQIARKSGVQLGQLVTVSENQRAGTYTFNGAIAGMAGGYGGGAYDTITVANQQLAINSRRVELRISVFATFSIE